MLNALATPKTQNPGNFLLHTSRHTTASDGSGPLSPHPPPGTAIARHLVNTDGGDGGAACLDKNSFTLTLKRPPTPPMDEEGKVRKSKRLAMTRLFLRFIGLPETTMVPTAAMVVPGLDLLWKEWRGLRGWQIWRGELKVQREYRTHQIETQN
ncbi:hypothetical protein NL676_018737 [Syzygium grande]|nr:hypothetical protein NL676_018737 [Syzygium grande]